jgi:NTE family protein
MMSPIMHYGNVEDMAGAFGRAQLDRVSKVLVVVANAQTYEDYAWSRDGHEPSLVGSVSASFDSAIGILNNETIGLARRAAAADQTIGAPDGVKCRRRCEWR